MHVVLPIVYGIKINIMKFFIGVCEGIKNFLFPEYRCTNRRVFLKSITAAIATLEIGFSNINWNLLNIREYDIVSLVRVVYPNTLAKSIIGVQQMTSPTGSIFTMKHSYQ